MDGPHVGRNCPLRLPLDKANRRYHDAPQIEAIGFDPAGAHLRSFKKGTRNLLEPFQRPIPRQWSVWEAVPGAIAIHHTH